MKIAVIAPSALPSRRANAIQTVRMAHAFARLGHEVVLIAYRSDAQIYSGEREMPSPPSPLPGGERGRILPSPLGRRVRDEGEGEFSSLLEGVEGMPSPPSPLPGGEGSVPSPPSPLPGGEGSVESPLSHLANRDGWEILAQEYGLETRFEVRWLRARHWARRYDFSLQALWEALRWGADCLFTRLPQAAAWGSLIGKATIFEVHDLPRGGAARWFRLFLMGKGAKRTVAISTALAADLRVFFPELCNLKDGFLITAPDGVDLSRYTPLLSVSQARQRLRESGWELPPGFIAGYTGHLYRGRGAELIVSLAAAVPEVHFLIVGGDGEQCRQLEQQFASQAVDNYTLTGLVAPQQVPLFQMASDALLMPYQAQVAASSGGDIARYLSPMKLFEYLASARPILASDLPVLREVLTTKNAILLPLQEIGAWESALRMLLRNPDRARELAESARRTAEVHSWESRAERILAG
ncbi:MAG: hypothetical protein Kow0088_23230 [Anaerolineales bacterium]